MVTPVHVVADEILAVDQGAQKRNDAMIYLRGLLFGQLIQKNTGKLSYYADFFY